MIPKPKLLLPRVLLFLLFIGGCQFGNEKKSSTDSAAHVQFKKNPKKRFEDYLKEIKKDYDTTSDQGDYIKDCQYEDTHKITFPLEQPAYALVHINDDSLKEPKLLTPMQLKAIIKILNDTSTYRWGEVGTPYFDKYITFHDKSGRCIAITNVSYDDQTQSTPRLAKMKYGAITAKGRRGIITVLEAN